MPSADQVPVKTSHSTMRWHMWVVLIAGSTGSVPFLLRRFLAGAWDGRRERFAQPLGIHSNLDTSAFLLEQHHRARIAAAPSTRERFRHLSEREIAYAHGYAELAAQRVGE